MSHPVLNLVNVLHINVPGGKNTSPQSINNHGQVVGYFLDQSKQRGFLFCDGSFTTLDYPEAVATYPMSINNLGQIVGYFSDMNQKLHGFFYMGGNFSQLDCPNSKGTIAAGINDSGLIVGWADAASFLWAGGKFQTFTNPDSPRETLAHSVNNSNEVLCQVFRKGGHEGSIYLYDLSVFSAWFSYTYPLSGDGEGNFWGDINNKGQVVGWFKMSGIPSNPPESFVYSRGNCFNIRILGQQSNEASGLNDYGQLVGTYQSHDVTNAYLASIAI